MERGSLALFGAIVAVGLGPAMWLGAQLGTSTLTPQKPPAVTVDRNQAVETDRGGTGAGSLPTDPSQVIGDGAAIDPQPAKTRKRLPVPVTTSPAPSPSPSDTAAEDETAEPSTPPSEEPSGQPSAPPTESTTDPVPEPSEDDTAEVPEPDESSTLPAVPEDDTIPVTVTA